MRREGAPAASVPPIEETQPRTVLLHAQAHPRVAVDETLTPGTQVGSYELIRLIGRGGMGEVHLARDTRLGRRVAIKFVSSPAAGFADRFEREARATARCHHENIVVIHEIGRHGRLLYMVLEYIVGDTLRGRIRRGPMPYAEALDVGHAIVRALSHAHAAGIVHRDLKPDNVMLASTGAVKVLDFGVAKAWTAGGGDNAASLDASSASNDVLATEEGNVIGTIPYMAPEQASGGAVDARTDIWGVGILLFQMIVGHHPLDLELDGEALKKQIVDLDRPMPSVADEAPHVPPNVAALVDRCLNKVSDLRFQSADELAAALDRIQHPTSNNPAVEGECPYPGLAAFAEQDIDRFFGRQADVRRALSAVETRPVTALIGPSGAGKSSFVRAGLTPALRRLGNWEVRIMRPGRDPLASLQGLIKELDDREVATSTLIDEPGAFGRSMRARAARSGQRLLLVIDPFEELYVQTGSNEAARSAFLRCLIGAADDESAPVRVLLCMRADFVHRTSEDIELINAIGGGMLFLAPLSRQDMVEALERPAELAGYRFEGGLAEMMAASLSLTASALPLLQFTATALWRERDRERRLLTLEAHRRLGGVGGALATHADRVLIGLDQRAREGARRLLLGLVTPDRTRAIAEYAALLDSSGDPTATATLIDRLTEARLLVINSESGTPTVEIAHESLISAWPVLARWVEAEQEWLEFRDELRRAARDWDQRGRAQAALWRGEIARDVYRWHERIETGDGISDRERAFANEVVALDQRALFAKRRLQLAVALVIALIGVGATIALSFINHAERDARTKAEEALAAEKKRSEAEERARVATGMVLASQKQLSKANAALKLKAAIANQARDKAIQERARAQRAEADVRKQEQVLRQQKTDLERQHVKLLAQKQTLQQQKQALQQQKQVLQQQKQTLQQQKKKLQAHNARLRKRLRGISTDLKP